MNSYTNQYGETFSIGDVGSRIVIGENPTEVEITKFSASGKNMFAVDRQGNEYSFSTKDRRERKSTNFIQFSKNEGLGQIASMLTGRGTVLNVGQKITRYSRKSGQKSLVVVVGFSDSGKNVFTQAPGEEVQSFSIKTGDERKPGNDEIRLIAFPEDQNKPLKKKEIPESKDKYLRSLGKFTSDLIVELEFQFDIDYGDAAGMAMAKSEEISTAYRKGMTPKEAVKELFGKPKPEEPKPEEPKKKIDFSNLAKWLKTNEEKIQKYKSNVSFRESKAFDNVIVALNKLSDKDKVVNGLTYDQYKNQVSQLFRETYPNAENVQQIKRLIGENPINLIRVTWDSGGSVEAGMLMFVTNYLTRSGMSYLDWRDDVKTITVEKSLVSGNTDTIQFREIDRPYGQVLRDTFVNNETPQRAVTSIEILKKYA